MKTWLCALLLLLTTSPVMAANYYVSTTGSNGASGTLAAPWRTASFAAATMVCGDTAYMRGGTYATETTITFARTNCTAQTPVTLTNYPGEFPIIHWSDKTNGSNTILVYSGVATTATTDVVIQNLEIWGGYQCIKLQASLRVIIRANTCHGSYTNGITATNTGGNRDGTIDRNKIYDNGDYNEPSQCAGATTCNKYHGIYVLGQNWTITNNEIYDNLAYGMTLDAGVPSPTPSAALYGGFSGLVANNTIAYNRNRAGMNPWGNGATFGSATIENNICYENSQNYSSSAQCLDYVGSGFSSVTVRNNVSYGTDNSTSFSCTSNVGCGVAAPSGVTVTNTKLEDPLFQVAGATIPSSPDFHLKSTSHAIGFGVNFYDASILAYTWDFFGTARSSTLPWNVGAITTTGGSGGSGGGGGTNQTVLVWSDTFNRAAEDPLTASNWVRNSAVGHQFVIPSNLATIAQPKLFSAGDAAMVWITNALNADQYCKVVLGAVSTTGDNTVGYGCSVRTSNGTKSDYAIVVSSLGYDIRRDVAGSYTSLMKASTTTGAIGDSFMLAVHGSGANVVLEAFKNNSATPFATVTDSSVSALQSGYAGIFYSSSETGQTPGSSTHGIDYVEGGNYFYGVDITAPTAPTGLTVTANLPAQLLISWTASTDAVGVTGYNVQACTPSVCTPSVIVNSPTTTSYTYTGLADNTGYSVRVNAFDAAANQSAYSSVVSTTTQTVASPTLSNQFPSGAAISDATPITISVTTSIPSVCKYNTRTQGTAAYASLQQTMTVSGLVASASVTPDQHGSNGGVNHFYVACDNAASAAHTSATLDLTFTMIAPVDSTPPSTISDYAMTTLDSVRLSATWSAATDAVGVTGYLLSGCAGAGCTSYNITVNAAPGTTSAIIALDASTVYNFIIQAYDAAGNLGVASNVATTSTFAAAPPEDMLNLSVSAILQQSVILQWTAPIVEQPKALFELCTPKTSATTCGGAWVQVAAIPLGTLPTISGLSAGTSYCFRGKYGNSQNAVSANASNIICTTTTTTGQTQQRQPAFIPRIQRQ